MNFFHTSIHPDALNGLAKVFSTTKLSEGEEVIAFEKKLEKWGVSYPLALNSGTSALHLALILSGVTTGDEVIIPSQTFIATGLAVLMTGAVPVFCDIEYETGNLNILDLQKKITPRTKAIIPVHWGGYPCDMDQINALASEHQIKVIEDAAHAIGASYNGKLIGGISDFTCFSFQAIKHLTTGDGGAIGFKSFNDFQRGKKLRWFGISKQDDTVGVLGEREYNLQEIGYKYHMNDFAAVLGYNNEKLLTSNLKRRREIAQEYLARLAKVGGLTLFNYQSNRNSSFWLFGMHVERRDDFIKKMNDYSIPVSVVHLGIHKNDIFSHPSKHEIPCQIKFDASQIHIPIHNGLTDEDVNKILNAIQQGW